MWTRLIYVHQNTIRIPSYGFLFDTHRLGRTSCITTLVTHVSVVPAPCSDHLALQFNLVADPGQTGATLGGVEPTNAPRIRRMGGAGNIKRWVEEVLPAYASELADIAGSAPIAAGQGRDAVHEVCGRLEGLFVESFGLVQDQDVPQSSGTRQPRWFDA